MTKVWRVAGRWTSILMVLGFFMPFFGISCAGQEIVTISGTDMVWGGKPGGLLAEGMGEMGSMGGDDDSTKVEKVKPEPLAIAAFACALIIASLAWVRKKGAVMGALGAGVIGIGAMIAMYVHVGGDLKEKADAGAMAQSHHSMSDDPLEASMEDAAQEMGNSMKKELPPIEAGPRSGFYLVSMLFVFSAVFAGFGLKDPGPGAAPPMAAGGPPVAYQMVWVPPGQAPPPGSIPPPGGGYPPGGGGGFPPPA